MKIYFDVKNQIITRTDRNQVIANSADYLEAEITFSAEWATMEKTMTFKNGNLLYTYVLVNDKILEENHLNLGVGTWKVSIQGVNEDKKIVTNECNLAVNASGWIGSEALPPESIWNQLLVIIQSLHTEVASTAALRSAVQKYIEDNYDALVKEAVIVDDVRAALDDMAEDGTLSDLLAPLVAAGMPEVVADQISAVVAAQIGGVVANQIGAVVASQITTPVNQAVKNYCDDNFSGWSGALDRGLAQPLMAAPADMVGAIKSALSDFEDDTFVCHHSENRVIVSELQKNKGINPDGSIVDSEGKSVTGIIKVEGEYAYFGYDGIAHSPQRVSLFDATQTFIERVNITTPYQIDTSTVFYIQAAVNTTSDNVYIGFFDSNEASPNYNSEYFADYYTLKTECLPVGIFDGLKCVAFGTSLTARAEEDHKYDYTTHGYLTYLRQYSGMTIDNQGLGGAKILSDTTNKSIYLAITGYTGYADKNVCIIEGFVNDWDKNNANALGTYTDTTLNSVCGRLRSAINYVLGQNANMTVIVILDHYGRDYGGEEFSSTTVKNGYTQFQYYDELAKVCESLGVKCIKEYALSEICQLTPQYLEDYIHCNDLGARQSATTIWNVMKGFSPNLVSA